jgi:hypothetical protein
MPWQKITSFYFQLAQTEELFRSKKLPSQCPRIDNFTSRFIVLLAISTLLLIKFFLLQFFVWKLISLFSSTSNISSKKALLCEREEEKRNIERDRVRYQIKHQQQQRYLIIALVAPIFFCCALPLAHLSFVFLFVHKKEGWKRIIIKVLWWSGRKMYKERENLCN